MDDVLAITALWRLPWFEIALFHLLLAIYSDKFRVYNIILSVFISILGFCYLGLDYASEEYEGPLRFVIFIISVFMIFGLFLFFKAIKDDRESNAQRLVHPDIKASSDAKKLRIIEEVTHALQEGIVAADSMGIIVFANRKFLSASGYNLRRK